MNLNIFTGKGNFSEFSSLYFAYNTCFNLPEKSLFQKKCGQFQKN